ncbi:MAG: Zn-dependent protease with chaperone function [Myxococcota bacterium]|jgi:Zn-dependent protease with chaperone function
MSALRIVDAPLKMTMGRLNEFVIRELRLKERQEVTRESFPRILGIYMGVLRTFDIKDRWPLYIAPMGGINAFAAGYNAPFLVLSKEAMYLDDALLRVVLSHEVAHLMSGHALRWTKLAFLMAQLSWLATPAVATAGGAIAASLPATLAMLVAMRELLRKGELTADRASALAMGGGEEVVRMLEYIGGLRDKGLDERIDAVKKEMTAEQRVQAKQRLDRWMHLTDPHPTIRQRVRAVEDWATSPAFDAIERGEYLRRGEPVPREPVTMKQRVRWGVKQISQLGERLSAELAR